MVRPQACSWKPFVGRKYLYFQGQTAQTERVTSHKTRLLYQHRYESPTFRNMNVVSPLLGFYVFVEIYVSMQACTDVTNFEVKFSGCSECTSILAM